MQILRKSQVIYILLEVYNKLSSWLVERVYKQRLFKKGKFSELSVTLECFFMFKNTTNISFIQSNNFQVRRFT